MNDNKIETTPSREEVVELETNGSIEKQTVISQEPEELIRLGILKGISVEALEKLLAMRRELKAEFAREAFNVAMANFQADCPIVKKDTPGGETRATGETAYFYAPLESIVKQVKGLIKENGFSYAFQTYTLETGVKVVCVVKHKLGHFESSDITVPLSAGTKIMSAPQITMAAMTFAKRYAFCNAFGILTGDEDNEDKMRKMINKSKPAGIVGSPVPPAGIPKATNPEKGMVMVFKKLIEEAKSAAGLQMVAGQIEEAKKNRKLNDRDLEHLRAMYGLKEGEINPPDINELVK